MAIRYTRHARGKFDLLKRHGFPVTEGQITDALTAPDIVIRQAEERFIAQKRLSERHVLRIVYRLEGDDVTVVTFYPGRRDRYESTI